MSRICRPIMLAFVGIIYVQAIKCLLAIYRKILAGLKISYLSNLYKL